jgi:hypothetical protein
MQLIREFAGSGLFIRFKMFEPKENLYYLPTSELNRFDLIEIKICLQEKCFSVFSDILQEGVIHLLYQLKKLNEGGLRVDILENGCIAKTYNKYMYYTNDGTFDYFQKNFVWDLGGKFTFFYEYGNKFYIEIAPNYPWHFSDPEEGEDFIPFEEYMKTYKPYAVIEIDRVTIERWIEQCEQLKNEMT